MASNSTELYQTDHKPVLISARNMVFNDPITKIYSVNYNFDG